ncbi:retrovirus-related pol polyprotein from transposon TNT 1-94 [Tanacetum coccineum]
MVPPNNLGPDLAGKSVNENSYRGMIRSLMYLTATRPDIQFSTVLCARYQSNPKESHLIDVKRILRYMKGTPTLGLYCPKCLGFDLKGYSDSDYAGCNMNRKSISGACQILGGKLVCWSAKKQYQLSDYDIHYKMVPIFCDNTSTIAISNNPVLHSRTKHIDIRYHFIRDHILKGDIELHFIPTEYQLADIFTKPLDEPTFTRLKAENKVWTLVPLPHGKIAIGTKWVSRNKKDEHEITTKNKASLVAQGYSQEEGIDYDETFAPVARMEVIRIFLAFATYMNFIVFQMDVKSVFLNGKLKEKVYVKQPPGFKSSEFPDYVCKLDKALN